MTVLSLCDGMGGGRIALDKLGYTDIKYYASEIKSIAIKCATHNYPDMIEIGDLTKVSYKSGVLYTENGEYNIGHVDLLLAGTPCQSFSFVNMYNNAYGLDGKSGLFLQALRILKEVNPTYFLFENVRMKKEAKLQLDNYLGVTGVLIDSGLVSFQIRNRYYWSNIKFTVPEDRHISFQDFKEMDEETCREYKLNKDRKYYRKMWADGTNFKYTIKHCVNVTNADKVRACTTDQRRVPNSGLVACDDFCRLLTRRELEQSQTVPLGYTDCLSYTQACNVLGDGWTIDVIAHILSFMHLT